MALGRHMAQRFPLALTREQRAWVQAEAAKGERPSDRSESAVIRRLVEAARLAVDAPEDS